MAKRALCITDPTLRDAIRKYVLEPLCSPEENLLLRAMRQACKEWYNTFKMPVAYFRHHQMTVLNLVNGLPVGVGLAAKHAKAVHFNIYATFMSDYTVGAAVLNAIAVHLRNTTKLKVFLHVYDKVGVCGDALAHAAINLVRTVTHHLDITIVRLRGDNGGREETSVEHALGMMSQNLGGDRLKSFSLAEHAKTSFTFGQNSTFSTLLARGLSQASQLSTLSFGPGVAFIPSFRIKDDGTFVEHAVTEIAQHPSLQSISLVYVPKFTVAATGSAMAAPLTPDYMVAQMLQNLPGFLEKAIRLEAFTVSIHTLRYEHLLVLLGNLQIHIDPKRTLRLCITYERAGRADCPVPLSQILDATMDMLPRLRLTITLASCRTRESALLHPNARVTHDGRLLFHDDGNYAAAVM